MTKITALPLLIACTAAMGCGSQDTGVDVPPFTGSASLNPDPGSSGDNGGNANNGNATDGSSSNTNGPGQGTENNNPGGLADSQSGGSNGANPSDSSSTDPGAMDATPTNGEPTMLGRTIEAETLNQTVSSGFALEPSGEAVGGVEVGSVLCFDNVDLTGVQSIDVNYARNAADVSASARFALLWGSADVTVAENLGERVTTNTGGWETFQPLNVGLARTLNEVGQLCIRGMQGNGILNVDSLTLLGTPGENDGVSDFNAPPPDPATVPQVARPQVVGNQVEFGGPNTSVAGNSFFWSNGRYGNDRFYNADVVDWLVQDWGSQIVRAAMAVDDDRPGGDTPVDELGGYLTHPFDSELNVKRVVNAAIENGIYVIIDWHAHLAEQNTQAAVEFFGEMASIYGGYNNVIYEIYNEPVNTGWQQIKQYAQPVMAAIRAQDPDNLIVVGTPQYSSDVGAAAADPIQGDPNVAYTLHFYAGEGAHDGYRARATNAMNAGIALFVTEWGTTPASGLGQPNAGSTQQWMDFLRQNNISHCNWALADQGEGTASQLVTGASPSGGWSDAELTQSGSLMKGIIQNW